jgi:hypothetical protein
LKSTPPVGLDITVYPVITAFPELAGGVAVKLTVACPVLAFGCDEGIDALIKPGGAAGF